jgi:hypothetical protein
MKSLIAIIMLVAGLQAANALTDVDIRSTGAKGDGHTLDTHDCLFLPNSSLSLTPSPSRRW